MTQFQKDFYLRRYKEELLDYSLGREYLPHFEYKNGKIVTEKAWIATYDYIDFEGMINADTENGYPLCKEDIKYFIDYLKDLKKKAPSRSKMKTIIMDYYRKKIEEIESAEIIEEEKGIMAGVPISAFLSNVFLNAIDHFYAEKNILYARYADDIILFCESEKLYDYVVTLENQILKLNLNLNQDKREIIAPNNKWTFLGFSYDNGVVDISDITKKKIKQKIKRFSKKIRRWMIAKNASPERALKTINRKFNKKFYFMENGKDLTWSRWFFPVINTTNGLREIDKYMQECLRYVVTGKHNKKNYGNIKYSYLKQCNYRPLVSEYYKDKKEIRQ